MEIPLCRLSLFSFLNADGPRIAPGPALPCDDPAYWTVMVPFMFIAMCGVQWYGYWPGGTFANEIV